MTEIEQILSLPMQGKRITPKQALLVLNQGSWAQLAHYANEMRQKKIRSNQASFTMFRIINYTNVCTIGCSFCSFKTNSTSKNAYILNQTEIEQKVQEGIAQGAKQVFFQGGVHPKLGLDYYTEILSFIKSKFQIHIRAFSPVEIFRLAQLEKTSIQATLSALKDAGLDSLPGAGAEILAERVRKILSPNKLTVDQWLDVMRQAHKMEIFGSANIVFGSVETNEEIIEHLTAVRGLQDETNGLFAFIPWTFQPQTNSFPIQNVGPHKYLAIVALSRLFLDNIDHIEASVLGMGPDLGALALHSGADDISSPVIEENVMQSQGLSTEKQAVAFLQKAGFEPVQRDFSYNIIKKYT